MWDEKLSVGVEDSIEELVDIICRDLTSGTTMRISFLHASTNFQEKLHLWQKPRAIHIFNSLPWLYMSDFNEILYHWENVGKREADNSRMVAFRELMNDCAFMDIESKGCAFTWTNYRDGVELVRKRLDRAICNMEWRVLLPRAEAFTLLAIGSDHSPLLLSLFPKPAKSKKEFLFEVFWLDDLECKDIVKAAWKNQFNTQLDVLRTLSMVVEALTRWSRKKFSNAHCQIEILKRRLTELINCFDGMVKNSKDMLNKTLNLKPSFFSPLQIQSRHL